MDCVVSPSTPPSVDEAGGCITPGTVVDSLDTPVPPHSTGRTPLRAPFASHCTMNGHEALQQDPAGSASAGLLAPAATDVQDELQPHQTSNPERTFQPNDNDYQPATLDVLKGLIQDIVQEARSPSSEALSDQVTSSPRLPRLSCLQNRFMGLVEALTTPKDMASSNAFIVDPYAVPMFRYSDHNNSKYRLPNTLEEIKVLLDAVIQGAENSSTMPLLDRISIEQNELAYSTEQLVATIEKLVAGNSTLISEEPQDMILPQTPSCITSEIDPAIEQPLINTEENLPSDFSGPTTMMTEIATSLPTQSQVPTPPNSPRQPLDTMYLVRDLIQAALNQAKEAVPGRPNSHCGYAFTLNPGDQLISTLEKALNAISGSECMQQPQAMVSAPADQISAMDAKFGEALPQGDCIGNADPDSSSGGTEARISIRHCNQMQGYTPPLDTATERHEPTIALRHMKELIQDIVREARFSGSEALSRCLKDFMEAVEELGAVHDGNPSNTLITNPVQLQGADARTTNREYGPITMTTISSLLEDVVQEASTMSLRERLAPIEQDKLHGYVERLTVAVENLITAKVAPRYAEWPCMKAVPDLIKDAISQAKLVDSLQHKPHSEQGLGPSPQHPLMSTLERALAVISGREYMPQAQGIATANEVYVPLPLE